jgi:NADH:ubiquinone oxidoreductase subunit F (NADH-binding)/NAD-dependent dihydropyrimidine dehydrogenase PreA subunit/(2Fe-2S) ferredoxin
MSTTTSTTSTNKHVLLSHLFSISANATEKIENDTFFEMLPQVRRDKITKPVIYIGTGTCGLGAGAGKTLAAVNDYITEKQLDAEVVEVGCIGYCAAEPLLDIQMPGKTRVCFSAVTEDKAIPIVEALLNGEMPKENVIGQFRNEKHESWDGVAFIDEHPFFKPQTRWVLKNCGMVDPGSIEEYVARGGYAGLTKVLLNNTPEEVCSIVEESGLRGRGGGGFPTGRKWTAALKTEADQKYMVCNADEGDPGAFMDRAVIEGDPHALVEGLAISSYAIGASKAYVYLRAEYPLAIKRLKQAIIDATDAGILGENIMGSGFDLEIIIKTGAGAFVCGEETALLHSIEGKRGMPRPRPPYPATSGLFGKPTIINNVETMANVPGILLNGKEWFGSIGTEGSKGTKVFALSGKVVNTGLVEVAMGTKVRDIVFDIGGGIPGGFKYKAVQIGGPSGGCIPEQHLDIQVDYESLKTVGAMMGSGGLVVMDEKTCMVDVAKFFMDFIQRESCGKCIPCREGTSRMLDILEAITRGRRSENGIDALQRFKGILNLEQLAKVIQDTSLCGLGQSAPNPVLSTLNWFRDEYEEHIYDRKCRSGVCAEMLEYTIDAEACTGCTICARKCPTDAIMGNKKTPHYIIQDKCIGCGQCYQVCKFEAVNIA